VISRDSSDAKLRRGGWVLLVGNDRDTPPGCRSHGLPDGGRMNRVSRITSRSLLVAGLLAAGGLAGTVGWARFGPHPLTVRSGVFPEEVVYVKSADDIVNAGMLFAAPKSLARPVAVIWVHGWGVNFYSPTYVMIGRALAARGLTTVSVTPGCTTSARSWAIGLANGFVAAGIGASRAK
jgi:hypothetical protein